MRIRDIIRRLLPKQARDRGRTIISSVLGRAGYVSRSMAGPVDLTGLDVDPADAIRRSYPLPCLIQVPIESVRNVWPVYFPCLTGVGNPFVETIVQYLLAGSVDYKSSALKLYYDTFQPATIAEALGLADDSDLHFLLHQPPLLTFPPWARPPLRDHQEHLRRRQKNELIENYAAGRRISHRFGCNGFGPVADIKGTLEFDRLIAVTDSIAADGFWPQRGPGVVQATVLRAGKSYRYLCSHGHHRTSALAALGYPLIPLSPIGKIIDRADMLQWPGVESKVFTPEQALRVFDMYFDGNPPETSLCWWRDAISIGELSVESRFLA